MIADSHPQIDEGPAAPARLKWRIRWRLSVLWALEWGVTGAISTYLPLYFTDELPERPPGPLLLGLRSRYQSTLAPRLEESGRSVVRWDDVIPEPF